MKIRFFTLILISVISFVIYLSYFGLETDKFDELIKENPNLNADTAIFVLSKN